MAEDIEIRITSDPRWLRLVRLVVARCCEEFGIEGNRGHEMVIAVDETLSNVIRHAYRGDTTRPVRVVFRRDRDHLEVEIWDRGHRFDPIVQSVPPPQELRRGGRGLFMVRSSVDECDYQRVNGWNRLRLRQHLPVSAVG